VKRKRVIRGGSVESDARYVRSAFRLTDFENSSIGIRPVRTAN